MMKSDKETNTIPVTVTGAFASPYVKASARPVQTGEKEKTVIQEFYPMSGEQWVTANKVVSLEKQVEELAAEKERLADYLKTRIERNHKLRSSLNEAGKVIDDLMAELEVTDKLLNEQYRVMDAIPECPVHGRRCIPHAVDWIDSIRTERAELRRSNTELAAGNESLREALGKCSQAREAVVEWVVNLYPHLEAGINEVLMGEGR